MIDAYMYRLVQFGPVTFAWLMPNGASDLYLLFQLCVLHMSKLGSALLS